MPGPAVESALLPGQDPRAHARLLRRVRDVALTGGVPPARPRPVIGASWRRVRWSGLDPGATPDVPLLGAADLQARRAASGLAPVMPLLRERLLPVADAAGQVLVVVDPDGRVLWREGAAGVRRRADALGFVEGSAWDEGSVGTNAIGTSLVVGGPVHVYAAEHYAESHQPWTCAAAPLHDPVSGRLLGAVDLSGPAATAHPTTVALVAAVTRLAELELRAEHDRRVEGLRTLAAPLLARVGGPAIVVSPEGWTAAATGLAAPARVALPERVAAGPLWLPALGTWTAEPLPGGWLLRPAPEGDDAGATDATTSVVVELDGAPPRLRVTGPSGEWSHALTGRHAEILLALVTRPQGRSAARLAEDLFGDPARTVTVRAEVSRLRRVLGPLLQTQPYRFADTVRAQVRLPVPPASLLPGSTAPVVAAARGTGGEPG